MIDRNTKPYPILQQGEKPTTHPMSGELLVLGFINAEELVSTEEGGRGYLNYSCEADETHNKPIFMHVEPLSRFAPHWVSYITKGGTPHTITNLSQDDARIVFETKKVETVLCAYMGRGDNNSGGMLIDSWVTKGFGS